MPADLLYRIVDEPRPGLLRSLAVNPFWPWLSLALGGVWLGVPWMIFNAIALGSATRGREIGLAVLMPLGAVALFLGLVVLRASLELPVESVKYLVLGIIAWKMTLGYAVHVAQSRAFELHRAFGGDQKNGLLVVTVAFAVRSQVLAHLEVLPTWLWVALT